MSDMILPESTCIHLPDSNRRLTTIYSDAAVYSFWYHDGVLIDARLKFYGSDPLEVIFLDSGRKVGSYVRSSEGNDSDK